MRASAQVAPLHTTPRTPKLSAHLPPELADLARLNAKEVCAWIGRCDSSLRDLIKEGRFPPPDYRDGPRCVRWNAGTVRRWLESTTQGNA